MSLNERTNYFAFCGDGMYRHVGVCENFDEAEIAAEAMTPDPFRVIWLNNEHQVQQMASTILEGLTKETKLKVDNLEVYDDRLWIKVNGFDIKIAKTDEGILVDVLAYPDLEPIASTYAFDSELTHEEEEEEDEVEPCVAIPDSQLQLPL